MKIDARSPEGNAYVIMGRVKNLLFQIGKKDEWPKVQERMLKSDYDNLCTVAEEATNGAIVVVNRYGIEDA